ncbi:hypothetical protein PR202_gb22719 [Eleusine coracana subsp. coracana]|uniref:Major facilitator superfamily (MFS) profile domain-containing protein n=1 Tax=Eleusine coracana subsp. coracana TaxID=191504 RepID=A0AAV5FIK2_ELECO|nr:hypothetical protein PR202_gb22719 [Eleusine coracana subsp. coracana]
MQCSTLAEHGRRTPGALRVTSRATESGREKIGRERAGPTTDCSVTPSTRAFARSRAPPRRVHHLLDESPLQFLIAMPPPLSALLVLPVTAAPRWKRPRLGRSRRARPAVVRGRAAALRALPWRVGLWPPRLAPVEVTPPPSSAPPPTDEPGAGSGAAPACCLVGLDAGAGHDGGGGGDGGEGADLGWLRVFPHVLTASMANFLFGYHIGVMNGPIEDIARELGFQGNPFLQGLVVSIFIVGAFFGSLGSSALVDNLGCKKTLQVDSVPLILGALLSAQADSLEEMLLGRFLVGIGIGVNTVLVPIYISEVAPTKYRGSLGTLCQIGTCLGIIAALSLGIPSESDPHWWRTMLYAACVPGVLIVIGMQFAVESPRWLAKVPSNIFSFGGGVRFVLQDPSLYQKALSVYPYRLEGLTMLEKLWRHFGNLPEVDKSMEEIKAVVINDDSQASWSELLVEPHNRVALIGGALFFLQQFAGINGVLYFSSLTFRDVGITSGALASLYVGITNLVGEHSQCPLLCMVFSFPLDEEIAHGLSITGTLFYIFTFALGAGPVTGIIIPELSSARTRSKVMGFSFTVHWICNFLVGLYFLEFVKKFGVGAVSAGFAGISLLTALFAYSFIVENTRTFP